MLRERSTSGGAGCGRFACPGARALLALATLTAGGCGGGDRGDAPRVRTTDAGTAIIAATDDRAGLKVEVQDNSLYVTLVDDAPRAARTLAGKPLGGACEVDGRDGVRVARQFPIYWRKEYGDWGSSVVRDPIGGSEDGPYLAQHVTSCRIFAPKPTGVEDQSSFNEATDEPVARVRLR